MPKLEPMANEPRRTGGRRGRVSRVSSSLAEINVVPLVDVMLVLLVIFMVAAPLMQQGFPVKLPQARRSTAVNAPVTVTVPLSFRQDGRVQIDGQYVTLEFLAERIHQAITDKGNNNVVLASDAGVTMGDMAALWDGLKAGGVESVGLQTQPVAGR